MANKEIIVVYQDCFMCGAPENWSELAKETFAECKKHGITPRKVSAFSQEGGSHAMAAIQAGVKTTPFFTDGKIYAQTIKDLIEAESQPQTAKKNRKEKQKSDKRSKKWG